MRRLAPGEVVAIALVTEALVADVWLIHRNHETISTCVRRHSVGRHVVRYLAVHLTRSFRWDPLTLAAARLTRKVLPHA